MTCRHVDIIHCRPHGECVLSYNSNLTLPFFRFGASPRDLTLIHINQSILTYYTLYELMWTKVRSPEDAPNAHNAFISGSEVNKVTLN